VRNVDTDNSAEQIIHLTDLTATLRRRQRVLESQRARFGEGAVPPQIVLELEDIARDLARHTAELRRLRPSPLDERNPYLGLLTFQEQDAERFFGRDALVADLVDRAGRAPFLAVLGASGSGKSSVVRAGVLPMLKGGALPGSERWRYVTLRPGPRPLDALAIELAKLQGGDLGAVLTLSQQLASSDRALLLSAGMLLDRNAGQRLVLLVDQAEELWTLAPSEPDAQATFVAEQQRPFIQHLLTAIAASDAPLLVILTMRADFLHRAAEQPDLAHAIGEHDVIISPMTAAELHEAIERPAANVGGAFEPGLADELIEQTLGRVGALPLLEYTLQELWKQGQPDGALTWAAYRALGGIEGALAARADAILAEHYKPEQQDDLRRLLLRLVQPGEGAADTRRRAALDDLVPAGASLDAVQALLQPLTDERLLVVSTPTDQAASQADSAQPPVVGGPSSVVELSHEALIRAWPTFGRWIAEARADLRFQLQLEEAARDWHSNSENTELLWSGLRLVQAEAWLTRAQPQLNLRDQAFLDASRAQAEARTRAEEAQRREREALLEYRAAAERRNASRLRIYLAVAGVFLLISVALTLYTLNQEAKLRDVLGQAQQDRVAAEAGLATAEEAAVERQAHIAAAQANAGESLLELGRGNADRALLLAQAAIVTDTQPYSLLVLRDIRQSIQNTVPSMVLRGHTTAVPAVAWAPNGKQVLTGSFDKTARIWIADDKPLIAELTRRVCNILTEDQIKATIPSWRGCATELAAVAEDLKEYDALRPRQ